MDQDQTTTHNKQIEHNSTSPKDQISPGLLSSDDFRETPPQPKKKYENVKDPAFVSSPIYPTLLPSKLSLSSNRDDHLMSTLSQDRFTYKSQLTFLYMHPTDYFFKLYDKNQDFFTSIASKILSPYQYWINNVVKIFFLQVNFLRLFIYDLETDKNDPSFPSI